MNELLHRAIAAHGGLDRFNQFKTVSASLVNGGALWSVKGQAGVLSTHVTVDLHQEHASFALSTLPNHRAVFTQEVSGILLPAKRRVFMRQPDNTPVLDSVVISIDLEQIRFA